MSTLILLDHENGELKASNPPTLAAALALGESPIDALLIAENPGTLAEEAQKLPALGTIIIADSKGELLAEQASLWLAEHAKNYTHVLAPASAFGKNIMPRAAALLDVQPISDITSVHSPTQFTRPIYAGNALATVESNDPYKFITVRTTAFELDSTLPPSQANIKNSPIEPPSFTRTLFVKNELSSNERPELTTARIVISGGRGMQSGDNFAMLEAIADKLGAAVGASRAAVDSGYVSNDYQVGQTGKVVAPELYIAVGISGAIQHLAGMKDSKFIVAINKDEDAPIFQVADYGWVVDLFEAIPSLQQELK